MAKSKIRARSASPKSSVVREGFNEFVTDTHPLVWHLWDASRLSGAAKQAFWAVDRGEAAMYIPAICLVEVVTLCESGKIPERSFDKLLDLVQAGSLESSYQVVSLSIEVVRAMRGIPKKIIPEFSDRTIVATALEKNLQLITRDEAIRRWDGIATIW